MAGRSRSSLIVGLTAASGLVACGAAPTAADATSSVPSASVPRGPEVLPTRPEAAAPDREDAAPPVAGLTLVVVFDQVPSWALSAYAETLHPEGIIRRVMARGVYVERSAYPFASTNTAPGHAHIFTGATPADSGVYANQVIDPVRGKIDLVDDGTHPIFGLSDKFASPSVLRVPTVGDALRAQRGEGARVVALSLKDRASVLPGGKEADLVLWYERTRPGFTSSTYYGPALPPWAEDWLAAHPVSDTLVPWRPALAPSVLASVVGGPDDGPGEGDYLGFGTVFPHDPKAASDPYDVVRLAPALSNQLVDLAAEAARQMALGADGTPDLLSVSISGTDYAGHTFGPQSWEYLDMLYQTDRRLGALLAELEARGEVSVLITSDHGVHPLPERSGRPRLMPAAVVDAAQAAAARVLGAGRWIDGFSRPFIYFSDPLLAHARRAEAATAIAAAVTRLPGVTSVYDTRRLVADRGGGGDEGDPTRALVAASVVAGARGELYVLVAEGTIVDEDTPKGKGTTHGTPYRRDREVPVLYAGPGIRPLRIEGPVSQARVAPTLAALLGIAPPAAATAPPLPITGGADPTLQPGSKPPSAATPRRSSSHSAKSRKAPWPPGTRAR
ncbi:MAG: alkaline phosphatase family protein [Myxococcota bacterium]